MAANKNRASPVINWEYLINRTEPVLVLPCPHPGSGLSTYCATRICLETDGHTFAIKIQKDRMLILFGYTYNNNCKTYNYTLFQTATVGLHELS